MPKSQMSCPNCRQPILAEIQQLFDVGQDPRAKQILLSGAANMAQCLQCGYQGSLATPIVYHDPEKELLLTFFPPDMRLNRNEQERIIGPLITKVVDSLPQDQRKGYLFSPQAMLTQKGLIERILEADGITKEMLDAQEQRMNLIQRLLTISAESRPAIIVEEDALVDDDFFAIFSRLAEAALYGGDDPSAAQQLIELQNQLLEHSTKGRELKVDAEEVQAARQALEALGEEITREKLVDLVTASPGEVRIRAYVQMTRPGMDYQFFQILSDRIEKAADDDKEQLIFVRDKVLQFTQEIDEVIEQRRQIAQKNLESLLEVDDIKAAVEHNLAAIDEYFVQALTEALEAAREAGDLDRSSKLQLVMSVIEEHSSTPPEFELIDALLAVADDEAEVEKLLQAQADEVTAKIAEVLTGLIGQVQASAEQAQGPAKEQQLALQAALERVFSVALRLSMEKSLKRQ